ncbi:MAG TPA: T9SS type A sorting domain-containing protein, partial [Bacteroidia bacterium]|nr:T9SS type A sorting domain-containing protein [Bacteroidia bacterium]
GFEHHCNPGFTESDQYDLRCYSDNSFGSYSTGISKTCDYVTGIATTELDKIELSFYPNPANDKVNVVFESNLKNNIELRIYDLTGRLVRSAEFNKNAEIPVADLENGIYTFTCTANGKYLQSGKLNVMH